MQFSVKPEMYAIFDFTNEIASKITMPNLRKKRQLCRYLLCIRETAEIPYHKLIKKLNLFTLSKVND